MTDRAKAVLEALKSASKDHPLTRSELKDITKLPDNASRDIIGALRDDGYRVVGSAGHKGYWLARTDEEYTAFRTEYYAKGMTYIRRVKAMDRYTDGQEQWEVTMDI